MWVRPYRSVQFGQGNPEPVGTADRSLARTMQRNLGQGVGRDRVFRTVRSIYYSGRGSVGSHFVICL
jgi:hypothetical protein